MLGTLSSLGFLGFIQFLKSAVFVVGYISNNNLFPEPLSLEEEKQCLQQMVVRRWRGKKHTYRKKFKISCSYL